MYIAPERGLTIPLGQNFNVNRNILSLRSFVASLKKISFQSYFIQFFSWFYNVYSPGAGANSPKGQSFDVNRNILSLHSFVACWKKKISSKSDFIQNIFMILYVYIEPGQGQTAPRGQNFDINRKALSLYTFVASFKFELVFIKDYAPNNCLSPNMAEFAVSYLHKKFWTLLKRLTGNLHIIPYQLTKFQVPSSNNFRDILLTSLKWPNFQRAIIYSSSPISWPSFKPLAQIIWDILLTRFH